MERPSAGDDHGRSARPGATPAIERRDSGLNLVNRVNRWMIAGALSVAGILSFVAAQAFHGRTVAHGATAAERSAFQQASSSAGGGSFGSPVPAPSAAGTGPGAVVSGGS